MGGALLLFLLLWLLWFRRDATVFPSSVLENTSPPVFLVSSKKEDQRPVQSPVNRAEASIKALPSPLVSDETEADPLPEDETPAALIDPWSAIQALYADLEANHDSRAKATIHRTIQKTVREYAVHLKEQDAWHELLALFTFLQEFEPDYPPYAMNVAIAHMALGAFQEAARSVSAQRYDPIWGEKVARILRTIEVRQQQHLASEHSATEKGASKRKDTVVVLLPKGNGFLVDLQLNAEKSIRLMLDTGATRTIIHRAFLEESDLSLDYTGEEQTLLTANGPVQASLVVLDKIALLDRRVTDFKVGVLQETLFVDFDGLLGMDFLGRYRFSIEPDKRRLILSDK